MAKATGQKRLIVAIIRYATSGTAPLVQLECGHETRSWATKRAACPECAKKTGNIDSAVSKLPPSS